MPVNFKGPARRLQDLDLPRLGREIGVGEDEIHAVLEVESAGSGFDSQGRPKILFEPHIFYRNLPAGPKRDQAVAKGLAYQTWGTKPYPKDSYPRFLQAMQIDEAAALKACSWGLPQVLGTNHKMCGYDSIQEMVQAFTESEALQLQAMIHFIATAKLDDDLRRHDWAGFARGYNGPSYAKHNYHGRLAAAYAKWKKIKNTPFDPKEDIRVAAAKETARHEAETPIAPAAKKTTTGMIVGGGLAGAAAAKQSGVEWGTIIPLVLIAILIGALVWKFWPREG